MVSCSAAALMPPTRDCLQQIHAACAAGVFRFLCTLTRDLHAAESQQARVFKIARHTELDWMRRNAVRERAATQMREFADAIVPPDDPDAAALQRELGAALAGLPEEQRAAVHLHLWEGPPAVTAMAIAAFRSSLQPLYAELHETRSRIPPPRYRRTEMRFLLWADGGDPAKASTWHHGN